MVSESIKAEEQRKRALRQHFVAGDLCGAGE